AAVHGADEVGAGLAFCHGRDHRERFGEAAAEAAMLGGGDEAKAAGLVQSGEIDEGASAGSVIVPGRQGKAAAEVFGCFEIGGEIQAHGFTSRNGALVEGGPGAGIDPGIDVEVAFEEAPLVEEILVVPEGSDEL